MKRKNFQRIMCLLLILANVLLAEVVREEIEFFRIDAAGFIKQCWVSVLYYGGPGTPIILVASSLLFAILNHRRKKDERFSPLLRIIETRSRDANSDRGSHRDGDASRNLYRLHPRLVRSRH